MKKFLSLSWMLFCTIVCYSQLTVNSSFINNSNKLNSQYIFPPNEDVSQDLFFSIGPNGIPQYGQSVDWNLNVPTQGKARFYHVKKGHWDRSAIRTNEEDINLFRSAVVHPPSSTPNINMGTDWVKLGKSWNFSYDNYAFAILSFTNQGTSSLDQGTVTFSHSVNNLITVPEIIIYNDWATLLNSRNFSGNVEYTFEYKDLLPGEIRHLYIKVDLAENNSNTTPQLVLTGEMTGFQSETLGIGDPFPPHDPNALTLITAIENTPRLQDCSSYSQYPEIVDACNKKELVWINHTNENNQKCPFQYSLNYPYSNYDSELLTYRITCFNDGMGEARHVFMQCNFDQKITPFEGLDFEYSGSHDVDGILNYPSTKFDFKEINLPGLGSRGTVYTYDECSAEIRFTIKTQCDLDKVIDANAFITFFDSDEKSVGNIHTNNVMIVPEQGVYTNYKPDPIPCEFKERNQDNCSFNHQIELHWDNSNLNIQFNRSEIGDQVNLQVFDISGRLVQDLRIIPDGFTQVQKQIDISNLTAGFYVVSVQSGKNKHSKKFIKH